MKNFFRPMLALALGAALAASVGPRSDAEARGATRAFDGQWSVIINTVQGDCGRSLRYAVQIVDGQVRGAESNYQVAGAVSASGSIHVSVAEAGRSASGSGRLSGNSGHGQWRTSTGECAGSWSAERRGGGGNW